MSSASGWPRPLFQLSARSCKRFPRLRLAIYTEAAASALHCGRVMNSSRCLRRATDSAVGLRKRLYTVNSVQWRIRTMCRLVHVYSLPHLSSAVAVLLGRLRRCRAVFWDHQDISLDIGVRASVRNGNTITTFNATLSSPFNVRSHRDLLNSDLLLWPVLGGSATRRFVVPCKSRCFYAAILFRLQTIFRSILFRAVPQVHGHSRTASGCFPRVGFVALHVAPCILGWLPSI